MFQTAAMVRKREKPKEVLKNEAGHPTPPAPPPNSVGRPSRAVASDASTGQEASDQRRLESLCFRALGPRLADEGKDGYTVMIRIITILLVSNDDSKQHNTNSGHSKNNSHQENTSIQA